MFKGVGNIFLSPIFITPKILKMKNSLLVLLFVFLLPNFDFAQVPSTCSPSAALARAYENDVKDLAVQRMYAVHSPDTSLILIPLADQDSIVNGMAAICNLDSIVNADSVFRKYCIHQFPNGVIRTSLEVVVDTTYGWVRQWRALNTITGNGRLDSFLARYSYTLTSYDTATYTAKISTTMVLNSKAFADSLASFPGVFSTYSDFIIGDHNYIQYSCDSVKTYKFRLGWGDCLSGCTSNEVWTYRVDSSCNVTLSNVTVSGPDPYPNPLNCNLAPYGVPVVAKALTATVYPNPVMGLLYIDINGSNDFDYSIYDMYGREVLNGNSPANNATINTNMLKEGVYVLKITGYNSLQTTMVKFTKL